MPSYAAALVAQHWMGPAGNHQDAAVRHAVDKEQGSLESTPKLIPGALSVQGRHGQTTATVAHLQDCRNLLLRQAQGSQHRPLRSAVLCFGTEFADVRSLRPRRLVLAGVVDRRRRRAQLPESLQGLQRGQVREAAFAQQPQVFRQLRAGTHLISAMAIPHSCYDICGSDHRKVPCSA